MKALSSSDIRAKLEPVFKKYRNRLLFGYCFGSQPHGKATVNSDIDLAFYLEPEYMSFDFQLTLLADCSRALKRDDIDLVILNDLKNLILAEEIVRNSVLIFDFMTEFRNDYELKVIHNAIDFRHQRKMIMGF